jgi:integrase
MSLPAITRRDIAAVLAPRAASGKKSAYNNVRNKLKTFFNWAIKQGLIESNPVLGTEKLEAKSRDRVLSMDELKAISQALDALTNYATFARLMKQIGVREYDNVLPWNEGRIVAAMTNYRNIIHLLMWTACRRAEISELEWNEVRTEEIFIDEGLPVAGPAIVLPPERTKNARRFIVPLSKPAMAILSPLRRYHDELVFSGRNRTHPRSWARQKRLLDAALTEHGHKLEHWVLHDIRRSVATHMGHMGIQPHVIEEVLNHYRHNTYNKSKLEKPKRQALEAWGEYLMAHFDEREPGETVVPIRA